MATATALGGQPTHIYYNARLDNYEAPGQPSVPLPAVFTDYRPAPLVNRAKDYELSIVRFQTSLQSLPALIVEHPTQPGATPSQTAYTFTIQNASGSLTASATVQWTPATPGLTQNTGDYFDPYWWEYDFIRFGTLVNAALTTAMTGIIAQDGTYTGVSAPYFSYDVELAVWSLTATSPFFDVGGSLQLWANPQAHHLFCGFPATAYPNNLYRYNFIIQPNETNYVRSQIPGSLTTWNPVRRFVFTTQTIPVVAESINSPTNYANGNVPSGLASQQIISDLTPDLFRGDELRSGTLSYTPTAQYRYLDLTGEAELRDIDFRVFWEDNLGNLHQHILLHNDFVIAKLLFHRKF